MRLLTVFLFVSACSEDVLDPDGFHWNVTVSGGSDTTDVWDTCNEQPVNFQEEYIYSLFFDGSVVDIKIGDESWSSGMISGCSVEYQSPIVGERRGENEEYWVKWKLEGYATLRQGGSSCELEDGVDWYGTETFTIVDTDMEDLTIGCTYDLTVTGTYLGQGG